MTFHLFIASCKENDSNIGRIIDNIVDSNIPTNMVHIISGGNDTESEEFINGVQVIKVKYRCFEFTPLIYVVRNKDKFDFEYGFFTHDTVIFGDKFYELVSNQIVEMKKDNYETKRIVDVGLAMNIGIYSKKSIIDNQEKLNEICIDSNDSKVLWDLKNRLMYVEDFIFLKTKRHITREVPMIKPLRILNVENKEVEILCKVFTNIQLIKIQTNFNFIKSTIPPRITNEFKNIFLHL